MSEKKKENQVKVAFAGGASGALEAFIMYPTEFVKTQLQLEANALKKAKASGLPPEQWPKVKYTGVVSCIKSTFTERGFTGFYRGAPSLIIGSIPKAGVRFYAYNAFADMLKDSNNKLTPTRTMLAGLGAGMTEAVFAVTPMETIKTKLIHDANKPQPRYKGAGHGLVTILREEGFGGIYKGLFPTMLKQGCNQATRFTIFNGLKDYYVKAPKKDFTPVESMIAGGIAGTISVYATMPFDVVKTRMQGLEAKQYSGSWNCFTTIVKDEGVMKLWNGTVPRLSRVTFSSGLIFTFYNEIMKALNVAWPEPPAAEKPKKPEGEAPAGKS